MKWAYNASEGDQKKRICKGRKKMKEQHRIITYSKIGENV
jgi:hypothetical protein